MLDEVITTVPKVIGLVGDVLSALTTTDGDLYPLLGMFAIGIAMSGFKFAIGAIRSVTWGA